MARKRRSDSTPYDSINLTPLIDTLFFLLIIFMVTAPLLEYSVDVSPPEMNADQLPQDDKKAKVVSLKTNGMVQFNNAEITRAEFFVQLAAFRDDPETKVYLRADRMLSYGDVIDFLSKVRNSGFSRWFWSHQGHIGQKKANIAVSRKILKMIYILLEKGQYYDPNYAVKAAE